MRQFITSVRSVGSGMIRPGPAVFGVTLAAVLVFLAGTATTQTFSKAYKITIKDEQEKVVEPILPVDPQVNINLSSGPGMAFGLRTMDNKNLSFGGGAVSITHFKIDGNMVQPGGVPQMALPPKKGSKAQRHGAMYNYQFKDIHVSHIQELVPSKPPGAPKPGQKRKMDTVLLKYVIENKGNQETKFALRVGWDAYNWTTDGPAIGIPGTGKILDGSFVEGKDVPEYALNIQNRDMKNPGHVAYLTFDQGGKWERASKIVCSSHGSAYAPQWEVPLNPNQFDTDFILYWAEKPLKPKEKRVIMFGYGLGLASNPDNEGRVTPVLGGSFEPGKTFTVTAYVDDPTDSQSLTLHLPEGMKLLEGKQTQPVPSPDNDNRSAVVWKGRVLQTGTYGIEIESSNGVTLTKTVTIEKAK